MRLTKTLFIILMLCVSAAAQDETLIQKTKKFKNSKRFVVKYDRFDDTTLVRVGPFYLSADLLKPDNNFQLMAAFSFTGQRVAAPAEQYQIIFIANGDDWSFLDARDLKAIVDGERLSLGEARRKGDVGRDWLGDVRVKEAMWVTLPAELFNKIAAAKKVEMRLGRKEIKFKEEHLQAFRDLASLATPNK